MDIREIVTELENERDRVVNALTILNGHNSNGFKRSGETRAYKKRRRLSAAGKRNLSEAMRKRWADRKKAGHSTL